jgi:hypothetical protein
LPDLILLKGQLSIEGSIGHHIFEFINGEYKYLIQDDLDSKVLIVYKNSDILYKKGIKIIKK